MRAPRLRPSQLGAGALVVAALAVGQVINETLPGDEHTTRPFESTVSVGESVEMRSGTLTVTGVDGAKRITRTLGDAFSSPGVIVVVSFDFVSRQRKSTLSYGELRDADGRITTISPNGSRGVVACLRGPVRIVVHCTATVEADPRTIPGATLGLAPDYLDPRFDSMAVVELGATKADVARWLARTDPLEIEPSRIDGMP